MTLQTLEPFESFWDAFARDVEAGRARTGEFPLTGMSRAVARAIWLVPPPDSAAAHASGLDVGTGTGIHSLTMAARGYALVDAVDINADALTYAEARRLRLWKDVLDCRKALGIEATPPPTVSFHDRGVDADWGNWIQRYDLITFNTPAYFKLSDNIPGVPAAQGVFVDSHPVEFRDAERSQLYRFFKSVVLPSLKPGGHVICSWPGLERRLIQAADSTIKSPTEMLAAWFGLTITDGPRSPGDFFNRTAEIASNYGLGNAFRANLAAGIDAGLYSDLVSTGSGSTFPQFKFGVMHLERDDRDLSRFKYVSS